MEQVNTAIQPASALTETSQIQINDLLIDFTTSFDGTWDDSGSGAGQDASTWRPTPGTGQDGFYPLGDLMLTNYENPNGVKVGVLVKDLGTGSMPALAPPTTFNYVWSSQIWMPVAPPGYIALGGVARSDDPPSVDLYRCVRGDLVQQALVGPQVYNDSGSGRRDDVSCWAIQAASPQAGYVGFSATTFIPVASYDTPPPTGFWAFQIPMPDYPPANPPAPPTLTSKNPPPQTGESVSYVVQLPWFAITDAGMSDPDRILHSPIYTIVRTDQYALAQFKNNNTSIPQSQSFTWMEGISSETVDTFAHSVGVELGMEWTIMKDVFSVSAKLTYSFTYTTSQSQGMQQSQNMTDTLSVPPNSAAAAYTMNSTYEIYRQDGKQVPTVTPTYGVPNKTYDTQFPAS